MNSPGWNLAFGVTVILGVIVGMAVMCSALVPTAPEVTPAPKSYLSISIMQTETVFPIQLTREARNQEMYEDSVNTVVGYFTPVAALFILVVVLALFRVVWTNKGPRGWQ